MPSVDFVLPHWLYWMGLIAFPIIAMVLSRRPQPESGKRSTTIAYFIWLVGGFLGFHRLYLKNNWGFLFWPLFAVILVANSFERKARIVYSETSAAITAIDASKKRGEKAIKRATAQVSKAQARLAALAADDQSLRKRQERLIKRNSDKIEKNKARITKLAGERVGLEPKMAQSSALRQKWSQVALYTLFAILALLLVDALFIPGLTRKANAILAVNPDETVQRSHPPDDRDLAGTGFAGMIDRLTLLSGEFVAFWSVIAVFVYYYEVIVRYVFNSPTNWVHESMFLMFGMQYLICGAYAMLTESHVRVDIFYANFSPRSKAVVDLLTSIFFFIFAGALFMTAWIFAADSFRQGETSFTEWAIQYWPAKMVIVLGALLLILQGLSKLLKDISLVISPKTELTHGS